MLIKQKKERGHSLSDEIEEAEVRDSRKPENYLAFFLLASSVIGGRCVARIIIISGFARAPARRSGVVNNCTMLDGYVAIERITVIRDHMLALKFVCVFA